MCIPPGNSCKVQEEAGGGGLGGHTARICQRGLFLTIRTLALGRIQFFIISLQDQSYSCQKPVEEHYVVSALVAPCSMLHAPCSMLHAPYSMLHAPCSMLHCSMLHAPCSPQGPSPLLAAVRLKSGTPVNVGVMFVPQQEAWVVERMGKYSTILAPGLNFLIPVLDKVSHSLTDPV